MRNRLKTTYRPVLERVESRIVATGGVVAAAAHHPAPHHASHVAPHHASHHNPAQAPSHPASTATHAVPAVPVAPPANQPTQPPTPAPPSLPTNTTTNQAWVDLVNMTGQSLEYQIKLGPYANGQFLPFDIGPGQNQYQMSSLISNGHRVQADFAIQFGNGPITPLNTGISQSAAQGYYIFLDSNLNYYVEPFIRS